MQRPMCLLPKSYLPKIRVLFSILRSVYESFTALWRHKAVKEVKDVTPVTGCAVICCTGFLFEQCSWKWIAHFPFFKVQDLIWTGAANVFILPLLPFTIRIPNIPAYFPKHLQIPFQTEDFVAVWTGQSPLGSVRLVVLHAWSAPSRPFSHLQPPGIARSHSTTPILHQTFPPAHSFLKPTCLLFSPFHLCISDSSSLSLCSFIF